MQAPTSNSDQSAQLQQFLNFCTREELIQAFGEEWLNDLIPDAKLMLGCGQGTKLHLEGDVAVHTSFVFENIKKVAQTRLGRSADYIERLSAVLHDVRKPATRLPLPDGGVDFPGHEAKAAAEVPAIAKRLGLSSSDTEKLYFLVAQHGMAHGFPNLSPQQKAELTLSPWAESLALLQEADARSCIFPDGSHLPVYWDNFIALRR